MNDERPASNIAEWTVSELAGALKRTVEDAFGFVRVRGEVSGYRGRHSSGHAYFALKDQGAKIDAVIWKGTFQRLRVKPEEGLEIVATGRLTTYPGKSTYQIVIDALEPAGIGALLAQLDERRRRLAAEGLFAPERKRPLPFLPRIIGVVTSPTGAVIRDIMHRLEDRFPCRVLVWPARVQGETCAEEVAAGIRGFNALTPDGPIPRPDVIIVARGGGSVEDLWGFNDEGLVRAAVASVIPLVAAVGHETDTTLIDLAADVRAPTPTGAAEMVVPVRAELAAALGDLARRHGEAARRGIERLRADLRSAARALPGADDLLGQRRQRLDLAAATLRPALARTVRNHELRLTDAGRRLVGLSPAARLAALRARFDAIGGRPATAVKRLLVIRRDGLPQIGQLLHRAAAARVDLRRQQLDSFGQRLGAGRDALLRTERVRIVQRRRHLLATAEHLVSVVKVQMERREVRLQGLGQLLATLSYKAVLARGFALVRDADGQPLRSAAAVSPGQSLAIEFADGIAEATGGRPGRPRPAKARQSDADQGALF